MWVFRQCIIRSSFIWIWVSHLNQFCNLIFVKFLDFSQALPIWKTLENTTVMMVKELTLKDLFVLLLLINSAQELQQWMPNYGLNLIHQTVDALMLLASRKSLKIKNSWIELLADSETEPSQKMLGLKQVLKVLWCTQMTIILSKWWSQFGMSVKMKKLLFTINKQCKLLLLWDKD